MKSGMERREKKKGEESGEENIYIKRGGRKEEGMKMEEGLGKRGKWVMREGE